MGTVYTWSIVVQLAMVIQMSPRYANIVWNPPLSHCSCCSLCVGQQVQHTTSMFPLVTSFLWVPYTQKPRMCCQCLLRSLTTHLIHEFAWELQPPPQKPRASFPMLLGWYPTPSGQSYNIKSGHVAPTTTSHIGHLHHPNQFAI